MVFVIDLISDCKGVSDLVNCFFLIFLCKNEIKFWVIIIVFLLGVIIVDGEFSWFVNIIFFILFKLIGMFNELIWLLDFFKGIVFCCFWMFGLYRLWIFFNSSGCVVLILIIIDFVCLVNIIELLIDVVGIIILLFVIEIVFKIVKFIEFNMFECIYLEVCDKCWLINWNLFLLIFLCMVGFVWKGKCLFNMFFFVNSLFIFDLSEVLVYMFIFIGFVFVCFVSVNGIVLIFFVCVKLFRLRVILFWI